jgi:hypothetical protein
VQATSIQACVQEDSMGLADGQLRFSIYSAIAALLVGVVAPAAAQSIDLARTAPDEASVRPPGAIDTAHTIARTWNEELLDAIRIDRPKPPVHARNLWHLSVAMWDAWAAFDPQAIGYLYTDKHSAADVDAARKEAISYAAYRLLVHRFPGGGYEIDGALCQPGAETSLASFEQLMHSLGFDPNNVATEGDSPSAIGNRIGQTVIDFGLNDGTVEGTDLCYPDPLGYFPFNPPLIWKRPGTGGVIYPNQWQPLAFDFLVLQNGIIIGAALQSFVGLGWGNVAPFALGPDDIPPPAANPTCTTYPGAPRPYFDPGCPPQIAGDRHDELRDAVVELILFNSFVDPDDMTEIDISPAVYGNNPVGTDDSAGNPLNPHSCEPYAPNVVRRFDFARVMSEFWADGPSSETPPGHWNTLANYVTDHPELGPKRIGGQGPAIDALEWDVKLYFALNAATHDAAIASWAAKHHYNSSRPITLVRHMAELGQSSDPGLSDYSPDGLPLIPGLIELITEETVAPGERHAHLAAHCDLGFNHGLYCETDDDCPDDGPFDGRCLSSLGEIALQGWLRTPEDPETQVGGVGWIRAADWLPYQKQTFVTPPFAGYTSGHSTFSRAAAGVLALFTGSPYFPGGMGTFVAEGNEYLEFEDGPSETVVLQWATYFDAADQAGISRRYGGIHPDFDDLPARVTAQAIGQSVFAKALDYYNTPYDPVAVPDPFADCTATDDEGDDEFDDEFDDEIDDEFDDEGRSWGRRDGPV